MRKKKDKNDKAEVRGLRVKLKHEILKGCKLKTAEKLKKVICRVGSS